ncbi:MAG TPA: heme lyase CcmF/NrfE family subunit [Candidatus Acidoferrales bacterium]|nr:heme lyase CcmF/NrfE family subunit [Candidatus Acidoferrales bacterium]
MDSLGSFALLLAFAFCLYSIAAALIGEWKQKPLLQQSAERAALAVGGLVVVATFSLLVLLLRDDFSLAYIASHSNRALPLYFKFAALWAGQEGSLLWWSCLLAVFSMTAILINRRQYRHLMPYAMATMMTVLGFFLVLNNFVASPFRLLASEGPTGLQVFVPPDGGGLNPLLQHPAMVIHPPMLYLGFVGFTIPFAFAFSALITRSKGEQWIHITRRWTMIAWGFLTIGVLLGGRWAYAVLGWGGYWGWDPVENASLLPWLTGTAFLHSVMMQEKRGMMKVWNMTLIFATFFLCIFGTFLTRSGVLSSVHAFAQSAIGPYFAGFLILSILFSTFILLRRLDFLKSENRLDSLISRESSFLFNNLILLASCFAVLWGTLFPLLSEAVRGVKISVGAPYFNKVQIPIGIFLLFLTGVGPLLAWRRTSVESLRRNFTRPLLFGAAVAVISFILGARNLYALMTIFMAFFVLATIAMEFHRGARVLRQKTGQGWAGAVVELTRRNTRRYGGYVIHFGIALMFIGFVGNAFTAHEQAEVVPGDEINVRNYRFVVRDFEDKENDNFASSRARIDVFNGRRLLTTMYPERRLYKASQQPTTEVAIRPRLNEDIYLVFAGMAEDSGRAVIQIYINPLVNWVWIGGAIMVLGTIIALIPSRTPPPAQARRRRKKEAEEYDSVAADD